MIIRFHGIDRHKKYSTIAVLDRKGEEVHFQPRCIDLKAYINNLGPEDEGHRGGTLFLTSQIPF